MKWSISYQDKRVVRELEDLPQSIQHRVTQAIAALASNPFPSGLKKLKGKKFVLFRIRVGDYRIVYAVEPENQEVVITRIGHRGDKSLYKQ